MKQTEKFYKKKMKKSKYIFEATMGGVVEMTVTGPVIELWLLTGAPPPPPHAQTNEVGFTRSPTNKGLNKSVVGHSTILRSLL